jgi:hypothetical protein
MGSRFYLAAFAFCLALNDAQRFLAASPIRFRATKRPRLTPGRAYCVAGKVNSVNILYLVIESVKLDTKHERLSTLPVPADGAGG